MKKILALIILLLDTLIPDASKVQGQISHSEPIDSLYQNFINPPQSALPRTWWHWTGSNITKEGITKDLEWMKRSGIGGFMLFDVSIGMGQEVKDKKVFFTPEWFDMLKHAVSEAERLGLEMTMHSSAGWSETGGPWVKPKEAVKKLVWSETKLAGRQRYSDKLPQPPSTIGAIRNLEKPRGGFGFDSDARPDPAIYVDEKVIAWPTIEPEGDISLLTPKISSSFGSFDPTALLDDDLQTKCSIPKPTTDNSVWFQYEYDQPVTVYAFSVALNLTGIFGSSNMRSGFVKASNDGIHYTTIVTMPGAQHDIRAIPVRTWSFSRVTAKYFRIEFTTGSGITTVGGPDDGGFFAGKPSNEFDVLEAKFYSSPRVNRWEDKANFAPFFDFESVPTPDFNPGEVIPLSNVIDLSSKMKTDGTLNWDVPKGNWTILRMGYSLTGAKNSPAVPAGTGYEVDKLSKEYLKAYYQEYTEKLKSTLGNLYGTRLQYFLVDSYEADAQNWTDNIILEFKKRRGYDPTPYLPVLAGWVVQNAEVSDRFLWDFRRTIANLLAEYHYEAFSDLAHAQGIKVYSEAAGISLPVIQDALLNKSKVDIPMGEFGMTQGLSASGQWMTADELQKEHAYRGAGDRMNAHQADVREAASAAHIYGKPIVATESWTGGSYESPADLKPIGDYWNTQGVNRFIFHTSTHQPLDTKPGNAMVGTHFHRNITWAEQAKPFFTYLARNSYLLQQGEFVADIAYFLGEGIPSAVPYWKTLSPAPPDGYDYDFINTEILLDQTLVKDGKVVLNSGMQYEVLVLPDIREMTLPVLEKVKELVNNGATVVGTKPVKSPSLAGYPRVDEQIRELANKIWGDCDGELVFHHAYGKGQVYWGIEDMEGILAEKGVMKDVEYTKPNFNTRIKWIHRQAGTTDIYFISNQRDQKENLKLSLRISGKQPEIWHSDNGKTEMVSYKIDHDRTIILLQLEPDESIFVVFRKETSNDQLEIPVPKEKVIQLVGGSWEVRFAPDLGAPERIIFPALISWTDHENQGVKYFSGTATYLKEIELSKADLKGVDKVILDLGEVKDIAQVFINGEPVEILWKKPYSTDISTVVKPGKNKLTIKVTNEWTNRIAGDSVLPDDEKILSGTGLRFGPKRGTPSLKESGLIGPVLIKGILHKQKKYF